MLYLHVMAASQTDYRKLIAQADGGMPRVETFSLQKMGGTLRCAIMKRAWEENGIEYEQPGEVTQTYFPEESVVVIDLGGGENAE
jgi:hypothetical protein